MRVWWLLICAVKDSGTRFAAFGVGVKSEADCSSGAGETTISLVTDSLLAVHSCG